MSLSPLFLLGGVSWGLSSVAKWNLTLEITPIRVVKWVDCRFNFPLRSDFSPLWVCVCVCVCVRGTFLFPSFGYRVSFRHLFVMGKVFQWRARECIMCMSLWVTEQNQCLDLGMKHNRLDTYKNDNCQCVAPSCCRDPVSKQLLLFAAQTWINIIADLKSHIWPHDDYKSNVHSQCFWSLSTTEGNISLLNCWIPHCIDQVIINFNLFVVWLRKCSLGLSKLDALEEEVNESSISEIEQAVTH